MIKYYEGTVFNVETEVIVNTVNCFGVMGAGIALEFKLRYPEMFNEYEKMCKEKKYSVGRPRIHTVSDKRILNFPTKNHWRAPSKIEWIDGLIMIKKIWQYLVIFPSTGTLVLMLQL